MTFNIFRGRHLAALFLLALVLPAPAKSEEPQLLASLVRWDVWIGPVAWPAAADLAPELRGSFDDVGVGIGGSLHVAIARGAQSDLLAGVDLSVSGVHSNVSGILSDVTARHFYFGLSGKLLFGAARNLSLDAGLGYHEADMAEVSSSYWGLEHQAWAKSRVGGFVGATWDVTQGRPDRKGGLTLGFKAHFVDFGEVYDESVLFTPIFGSGAGNLDGPIYVFQVGYSAR